MSEYENIQCLGYQIFNDTLDQIELNGKKMVNTINQYSYCMAEEDPEFKAALKSSDILLPDGVGIVAASRFLKGHKIRKIAGAEMHKHLLRRLNKEGGTCFYLGATNETLEKIRKRISKDYPNIQMNYFSPPYKESFTNSEISEMINAVNTYSPDVLFVGMTAPKQEKWAHQNIEKLDVKLVCSIGAVFDFYAGTVKRPASFFINSGLEWFGRLIKEPRRMQNRYINYGAKFTYYLLVAKYKLLFNQDTNKQFVNSEK